MCQEMTLSTAQPSTPHGLIRLATADSMCAPLLRHGFSRFKEQYPHISLKVTTAGTSELFRMLDHNEVDLVCTLDSHIYNTNYVIAAEERVGLHFVVSSAAPLARSNQLDVRQLLEFPFLLTEKGMSYRRLMDEMMARHSIEVQPVLEIGRADIICSLVEKGAGISFLPDFITRRKVEEGGLVYLNVPELEADIWQQLIYPRNKWISRPLDTFLRYVKEKEFPR
jgi:DNA-binding transcriptional LysR family regulator